MPNLRLVHVVAIAIGVTVGLLAKSLLVTFLIIGAFGVGAILLSSHGRKPDAEAERRIGQAVEQINYVFLPAAKEGCLVFRECTLALSESTRGMLRREIIDLCSNFPSLSRWQKLKAFYRRTGMDPDHDWSLATLERHRLLQMHALLNVDPASRGSLSIAQAAEDAALNAVGHGLKRFHELSAVEWPVMVMYGIYLSDNLMRLSQEQYPKCRELANISSNVMKVAAPALADCIGHPIPNQVRTAFPSFSGLYDVVEDCYPVDFAVVPNEAPTPTQVRDFRQCPTSEAHYG